MCPPPASTQPLLTHIIERFQARPAKGVFLVAWVRELLNTHTA